MEERYHAGPIPAETEERVTVERAVELLRTVKPLPPEEIPAMSAHGRTLARDRISPIDQPPFPRSPLDGYAFHAEDSRGADRAHPTALRVVATVYAGDSYAGEIRRGEAVRLMTGAPIPAGCDCVLRHEDTDNGRETVRLYRELTPGSNYCHAGEDFRAGEVLLPAGTRLDAVAMGVLAAAGLLREGEMLPVFPRLRCAVLCTGDELVSGEVRPLPPGKIYSANETLLRARLAELGMELLESPGSCADRPEQLAEWIDRAAGTADLIITTGGVSAGDKDILHETLPMLSAERVFRGVRMKPGSPMMFSFYRGIPILSLSGNPFAAWASFEIFGRELLAARSGLEGLRPRRQSGTLRNAFPKSSGCRRFIRGVYRDGGISLPEGHSSGQLANAAAVNCLVDIPAGSGPLAAGEAVEAVLL